MTTSAAVGGVRGVTNVAIGRRPKASADTTTPSSDTSPETPTNTASGATDGKSESAVESLTSKPLVVPSSGSSRRWRQPRSVREFAAQVNAMATAVLNGEVSNEGLEAARLYAGLARTVAQAMTTEVQRARFLGLAPELNFDVPEDE